jgi:hypothetical protein
MKLTTSNATVTNTVVSSKLTIGNNAVVVESLSVGNVSINSSAIAVGNVSITPTAVSTPSLILGGTAFVGGTFGGIVNYQEFTANSTWYNPLANAAANASLTGNEQVFVMAWGGGGGGVSNNTVSYGGGGGACVLGYYSLSNLANTISVTVGSGGAATRATTTAVTGGTTGGNTSFGSLVVYGAIAGASDVAGGGGGILSGGTAYSGGSPLGGAVSTYGGGQGSQSLGGQGGSSIFGGGGGARNANAGGTSVYGGGGGAAANSNQTMVGGTSILGGSGGAANTSGAFAGSVPAGGGGATNAAANTGARGEVRVWVIGPGSTTAGAPTYTLTANTTTLNEGSSVLYTVSTTNVANNTTLYYTLNNSSTAVATDFTTAVNGSIIINSGTGTFTLSAVDDSDAVNESFQMDIRTSSSTGSIVASNGSVSIIPLPPVTVINRSTVSTNNNDENSYTFTNMAIGTASTTRRVIAVIFADSGSTGNIILSTATIGGISATIDRQVTHTSGGSNIVAIVSATVPTGTTATVVASFSGSVARGACWVVSVDGLLSVTPHDTLAATTTLSGSIDWINGGFVVGGSGTNDDTQNFTWVGLTERAEQAVGTADTGAADLLPTSTETNQTVSSTSDGSGTRKAMVVVSYR